jgi:hypothetical protein
VLLGIVECHPLCQVCESRASCPQEEQCRPQGTVCHQKHCRVLGLLRQSQELLAQGARCLILGADLIIITQAVQRWEQLMGVGQVMTELPGAGIGLLHLRRRIACGGNERRPQGDV